MAEATKKRVLVVGLGETGYSCVNYLQQSGYDVSVADSRDIPPRLNDMKQQFGDIPLHTGPYSASLFGEQDLLVVSPGVSLKHEAITAAMAQGVEVVGDVELFVREARAPIIAITGTNGKSTVTALLGEMIRQGGFGVEVAGNIGVPVLDLLHKDVPDYYVLELSSFQLETTPSLQARAATILNISPDHLDRYTGIEEYAQAKFRILTGAGAIIVNADDDRIMQAVPQHKPYTGFGAGAPQRDEDFGLLLQEGETWLARGKQCLLPTTDLVLAGRHNYTNVLAALALGSAIDLPMDAMLCAAKSFSGLPHRNQLIKQHGDIAWIDDSKATNVGAAVAALRGQSRPVILIAGGEAKETDFAALKEAVVEHARAVILIGRDAALLRQGLQGSVELLDAKDMYDAVQQAQKTATSGDVVLLAPACASFDMFRNYIHRGEVFQQAVEEATRS